MLQKSLKITTNKYVLTMIPGIHQVSTSSHGLYQINYTETQYGKSIFSLLKEVVEDVSKYLFEHSSDVDSTRFYWMTRLSIG